MKILGERKFTLLSEHVLGQTDQHCPFSTHIPFQVQLFLVV